MRHILSSLGLLTVLLSICSCQQQYAVTVSIHHFKLTNESVQSMSDNPIEQSLSITVSYEITDKNDEVSTVMLADGPVIDGKLVLTHRVTEPTEVEILVSSNTSNLTARSTVATVLKPSSEIDFVVIHRIYRSSSYATVLIKGNEYRSLQEHSRFSIKGNLSHFPHLNSRHVQVLFEARPSVVDGRGDTITYGPVLVDGGEFSVEGDLDGPTLFTIKISYGTGTFMYQGELDRLHAILEPGVNYRVVPWGKQRRFAVVADQDSLHTQLVSSWQLDPEFIGLVDTLVDRELDMQWGMETEAIEQHEKEQVTNYQVSERCAHVRLTDEVKSKFIELFRSPYQKTFDQLVTVRTEALRKILRDTHDAELVRIIFELIWRQMETERNFSAQFLDELVATLSELERKLDQDYIDQFIAPRVEYLKVERSMELRNRLLRPGQVAPQFTLPNIKGDEVSLSEVLNKNELVLVDFWASWCDSCSRSIQVLNHLYRINKDRGFEIVTISIDDSVEAWKAASKTHELPWINLGDIHEGEMKGGSSPTADNYGVRWIHNGINGTMLFGNDFTQERVTPESIRSGSQRQIPNAFLIDNKGCILHKQFSNFQLQKMLSALSVGSS